MRPVLPKPKPQTVPPAVEVDDELYQEPSSVPARVQVSQIQPANSMPLPRTDGNHSDSASEYAGSSVADESEHQGKSKSKHNNTSNAKHAIAKKEGNGDNGDEMVKRVRKISSSAHANFRRLKLRNTGAKGAKSGGKFSRRRR